jgi:hypothetical protein
VEVLVRVDVVLDRVDVVDRVGERDRDLIPVEVRDFVEVPLVLIDGLLMAFPLLSWFFRI